MSGKRYISQYASPSFCVQLDQSEYIPDGHGGYQQNVLQPLIDLKFRPESLYPWEVQAARERLRFRGTTLEIDGVTPIDPIGRVGVLDTGSEQSNWGWSDEKRVEVENKLESSPFFGVDFILVEAPRVVAPWPAYDDVRGGGAKSTAQKLVEIAVEMGFCKTRENVDHILAYEAQNANRPDVLAAFRGVTPDDEKVPEGEEIVAA